MIRYFRGELKSDPFWINKKSNAAILSKRHQGVRGGGGSLGNFLSSSRIFWHTSVWVTPRHEICSQVSLQAREQHPESNQDNFNECTAPLPCMLRSQYFVLGGKTRASRPHNFSQWLHRCIPSLPFCKYQAQLTSSECPWPTWTSSWARRPWCRGWRWWWTDRGPRWRRAGSEPGTRTRWRCRSSHWLQHTPWYSTFVLMFVVCYLCWEAGCRARHDSQCCPRSHTCGKCILSF